MRVLQYNILNGCEEDGDRLSRLGHWLRSQAYDVVGLNELNGWNQFEGGIEALGKEWGYPYSTMLVTETSKYFIGMLSKHPIQVIDTKEKPFHHGVLHVKVLDVHYIVTHLDPFDALHREEEAAALGEMIESISSPLLLMGDLNTLSSRDNATYENNGIINTLKQNSRLARKFLTPNQEINYEPMRILLNLGLTDICDSESATYSVPTKMNQDGMHATKMRLDYMLANQQLLARAPKAKILQSTVLDALSDHYPVECTWNSNKTEATEPVSD